MAVDAVPSRSVNGGHDALVSRRLPSLTGLRWIGAMLVFGFHVGTLGVLADPTLRSVTGKVFFFGLSGVQFFFVLSGFVLVWSYRTGEARRTFYRRRIAKIFPNHVVMWAAVIVLLGWFWGDPVDARIVMMNLFLVQAWNPTNGWFYSVNTVSWSLSCELFFYLSLPLALPVVRRLRPWALRATLVALPLLIVAVGPAQALVPDVMGWWFAQVFPLVRSLEFWLGVVAAELMLQGRWHGPRLAVALGVIGVVWVASTIGMIPAALWTCVFAVAYVLVIAAAAEADVRGTRSPFRNRPLMWLGEVSFAFYLVHVFIVSSTVRALGRTGGFPGWWGPLAAVGLFGLCLLSAWLLFRYVETPMVRLLGPPRRGRPARADKPAAVG
jgi:peptidoglycan/LPS O-acetylase OafA/YrhL